MYLFLIFYLIKSKFSTKYKKEKNCLIFLPSKVSSKLTSPWAFPFQWKCFPWWKTALLKKKKNVAALCAAAWLLSWVRVGWRALLLSGQVLGDSAQDPAGIVLFNLCHYLHWRRNSFYLQGFAGTAKAGRQNWGDGMAWEAPRGRSRAGGTWGQGVPPPAWPWPSAGSRHVCVLLLLPPLLLLGLIGHRININTVLVSLPSGMWLKHWWWRRF